MLKKQRKEEKSEKTDEKKTEEIEVVFGDDSMLNISEVGDCMNDLRPKDSVKNRKKVIIPVAKKKRKEDEEETDK